MRPIHTMSQEENSGHGGTEALTLIQKNYCHGGSLWGRSPRPTHAYILRPTERCNLSMSSNLPTTTPSCVTAGKSISLSGPQILLYKAGKATAALLPYWPLAKILTLGCQSNSQPDI